MQTIRAVIDEIARTHPHRTALQLGDTRLTYHQLEADVARVTHNLRASGITSADTVALVFQNTPACIIGFLALACLNASVIPLGVDVSPQELRAVYNDARFAAVLGCSPTLSRLEQALGPHHYPFIDITKLQQTQPMSVDGSDAEPEASDKIFVYHYTSGSTGKPKAALHSQMNLINGGTIYRKTYHVGPEDSILVPVPLCHSFGMVAGLVTSLMSGSRLVLVERFAPNWIVQILARERISILIAVPLVYNLTARCSLRQEPDLSALRVCLSSGAPLPPDTAKSFWDRYDKAIYQVYGSTETGVIAAQWPDDQQWPQDSIGRPLDGVRIRIVDEQGQDLPAHQVGNLLVKTPAMFTKYLNHSDATARAFHDGWYITGDLARQDDTGCLYLVGRKDTFINVGGQKVNPLEVEEVLLSHPIVREAVVFGSAVGTYGEHVRAAVVLSGQASEDELIAFCREQLAAFKVPSQIAFVAELPKTSLGKIRRLEAASSA